MLQKQYQNIAPLYNNCNNYDSKNVEKKNKRINQLCENISMSTVKVE